MNANTGKAARPGNVRRKATIGLAGVGPAAAIVGAGIAALAAGSTPSATAQLPQPKVLTATLTADFTNNTAANAASPSSQPLFVQAGLGGAAQPLTAPGPLSPSRPLPDAVAIAGGAVLSFPFAVPGGPGASGNDPVLTFNPFAFLTSPAQIGSENAGGSWLLSGLFNLASNGTITGTGIPATSTGARVLPSDAVNAELGPTFELDPLPTVPDTIAAQYSGLPGALSQLAGDQAVSAAGLQIGQAAEALGRITLPGELTPQPGADDVPARTFTDATSGQAGFASQIQALLNQGDPELAKSLGLEQPSPASGAPGAQATSPAPPPDQAQAQAPAPDQAQAQVQAETPAPPPDQAQAPAPPPDQADAVPAPVVASVSPDLGGGGFSGGLYYG